MVIELRLVPKSVQNLGKTLLSNRNTREHLFVPLWNYRVFIGALEIFRAKVINSIDFPPLEKKCKALLWSNIQHQEFVCLFHKCVWCIAKMTEFSLYTDGCLIWFFFCNQCTIKPMMNMRYILSIMCCFLYNFPEQNLFATETDKQTIELLWHKSVGFYKFEHCGNKRNPAKINSDRNSNEVIKLKRKNEHWINLRLSLVLHLKYHGTKKSASKS